MADYRTHELLEFILDRLGEIIEALAHKKATDSDLIGLCPHGYLRCFYCWRDAGFPGGGERG